MFRAMNVAAWLNVERNIGRYGPHQTRDCHCESDKWGRDNGLKGLWITRPSRKRDTKSIYRSVNEANGVAEC
ncbi:hypothetical protein E2C01_065634 [Portunus trituberculatus]|uniref:Uncharacterized protein n=1 Tax=Portunus trituberculatus TaxID=210409 RepID=A0A5B7HQ47_PORTR|nr:hypothetical protein [Portunus trituberculatus]